MSSVGKYRVTTVTKSGTRRVSWMGERQLQAYRAKRLSAVRRTELRMTQKDLAGAVGANLRTLQDWERGRSAMPKPVEILIELMRDMPVVRRRLLSAAA